MTNVIVTGGAGFIGSHLTSLLLERGYTVSVIDNLYSGKEENIEPLMARGVHFWQESVTNLSALQEYFHDIDFVFHLAAIASVPFSVQNPLVAHEVNLNGTLNVLEAARNNNVRKVIFVSSSAVYGDTPVLPQNEDINPAPMSPYAATKLAGEYYCRVFREVYQLQTVCLRYFNVYGPRQDPNSQYAAAIPKFISAILRGRAPVIFGDGDQTRDFVFVKDAANAAILAAESSAAGSYNIATGQAITINELTRIILEKTGSSLKPLHLESRSGDILHSVADISRARSFGYRPGYSLEQGLEQTVSYFLQPAII